MMMLSSMAFSQNAPITFETGAFGNAWTWTTFENGPTNPAITMVANPSTTGINSSATVCKFTATTAGQPWAGYESSHGAGIGSFTLSSANCVVKMMVYKSVLSDVGIKFATPSGGSTGEIKVANTVINQWEELTFNFAGKIGETNDQIIIFPDFQSRTTNNDTYVDNITFSAGSVSSDPTTAAPTPTAAAANVISMFSNAYTNVGVDTWRTSWSAATLTDIQIAGNDTKKYSSLDFVGIETTGPNMINASTMTKFHVNAYTPNMTAFRVKLVDFGADGAYGGGDDKDHELVFTPTQNAWNSYDINLSDFTNLTATAHIAQLIFSGLPAGTGTVYIDNVYFSKPAVVASEPTTAAPTPTALAADVISMFSNAYTNVGVDTWRTSWSAAILTDVQVAGNDTKKYTDLNYVGIETTGANLINASSMTKFHVAAWTPNMTTFRIKLVDFGADAAFGGGDDKEHELSFTPIIAGWNSYDIPLTDFVGLTTTGHIAQLIFSGNPAGTGTVFIDNVYFSKPAVVASEPTTAAPTPTALAADVISMFSNAYTNVGVDTWRTSWSVATLTDVQVAGNDTKKYTDLDYVGIETVGPNMINASNMTKFHLAAWTPNMTTFRIKLVDFGADAAFGGGDDKEHELSFTPIIAGWNSYDIPLTDFVGLTTTGHIGQLIFSGNPAGTGTVFIDNVYFSKPPTILEPTTAATTPTALAANVISMFSNAYTNVGVDTWRTGWSVATLTEMQVAGDDVKKYSALDYVGIETTGANLINASTMSHFNVDVWTPNMTTLRIKLVDFGADAGYAGGDDTEHELTFTPTQNGWVSLNIPLTDFTNLTNKSHIAQLIFSGAPTGAGICYIDNVYFSKPAVGINNASAVSLNVYPNPTANTVTIKGLNVNEINIAKIYSIEGKLVATQNVSANGTINLASFTNGTYLVKVNEKVARVVKN